VPASTYLDNILSTTIPNSQPIALNAHGLVVENTASLAPGKAKPPEEVKTEQAQVGMEAPDSEANAFVADGSVMPIRLSDYKGKWILLYFYPGDFTFV
jgi:hypothetical protein